MVKCPKCKSNNAIIEEIFHDGSMIFKCQDCGKKFSDSLSDEKYIRKT